MSSHHRSTPTGRLELPVELPSSTDFDRQNVAFVKVDGSMAGRLTTGTDRMVAAVRDIYNSQLPIDQVEFFAFNRSDGVIFAVHPHVHKVLRDHQSGLNDVSADGEELPEPLSTTVKKLREHLPKSLTVSVGTFPFGVFGTQPVTTFRLVMEDNQTVSSEAAVSNANLEQLLEDLRNESFLYHCHIRRNPGKLPENYEYQASVRIALFGPEHQFTTTGDLETLITDGPRCDPTETFAELGVSSNVSVFSEGVGISPFDGSIYVGSDSPLESLQELRPYLTGKAEYTELLRGRYGAPDVYDRACAYTSLMLREADLSHFVGLGTATPDGNVDQWATVPGSTAPDLDVITTATDRMEREPIEVSVDADPDDDIATASRTTANDGTPRHWGIIKDAARTFRERGCSVYIPRENTESRPDLWIQTSSGEILAVEVESSTKSKAANLFTNVTRQAMWGYETIVVMDPGLDKHGNPKSTKTAVDWAVNKLAKPMKELDDTKTSLFNTTALMTVDDAILLLPEGVSEAEWWLTWENECLLCHEDEVLARGPATAPFSEFEFDLPRLLTEDGNYLVESADGERLHSYSVEDDVRRTRLRAPHVPVDLSYLRFVDSIYAYDDGENRLEQHEMSAKWDVSQASERHERSHEDAFTTFIAPMEGERIYERECWPFIREWIGSLSSFSSPVKSVYGQYRKDYVSRHANSTETGKVHHYADVTFRYDRGLVAPSTPGLRTTPQFPDEFDVEPADVLKDPLIYGLDSRDSVLEEFDEL